MTNLRLLFVLIVLATVCWEANCLIWQGPGYRQVCSIQPEAFRCPRGQIFKVLGLEYQRISGPHNYNDWSPCVRKLKFKVHKKCGGRRACRINARSLALSSKCKNSEFCLMIHLRCQGRWK